MFDMLQLVGEIGTLNMRSYGRVANIDDKLKHVGHSLVSSNSLRTIGIETTNVNRSSTSLACHFLSLLVACATFLLIIAGALVTSHDAGLATSDWPLSNGQVFPRMVGNLFWEHGHRMVATTVGLLTIVLTIYLRKKERRRWVRRLVLFGLLAVIAQGLLGGLTVKLMLPLAVSAAHATLAQLFFCTTVSLAVVTAPSWHRNPATIAEQGIVPVRYLCLAVAAAIFLQLILGATLRHSATWDKQLPTELLLAHVGGAFMVTLLLAITATTILRRHPNQIFLTRPALIALALLGIQLLLGLAAYVTRQASPNDPQPLNPMVAITVAHVACGALVFATTIILTLRSLKRLRSTPALILAY